MPGSVLKPHDADLLARASAADRCSPRPREPIPACRPIYGQALAIPYSEVAALRRLRDCLQAAGAKGTKPLRTQSDGVVLLDARGIATAPCVTTLKSSFHGRAQNDRTQRAGWLAHTDCTDQPRRAVGILRGKLGKRDVRTSPPASVGGACCNLSRRRLVQVRGPAGLRCRDPIDAELRAGSP